jgi:hypothetical protein
LVKSVVRRIVDRRVLHLIKMWLECPVEETDERGRKTRTIGAKDTRRGIPQGSPLSPLLANLYMRRFVLGWKKLGLERSLGSRIVTYADDLVILCRKGNAEAALQRLREIMERLKLTVNEEKTRICGEVSTVISTGSSGAEPEGDSSREYDSHLSPPPRCQPRWRRGVRVGGVGPSCLPRQSDCGGLKSTNRGAVRRRVTV